MIINCYDRITNYTYASTSRVSSGYGIISSDSETASISGPVARSSEVGDSRCESNTERAIDANGASETGWGSDEDNLSSTSAG